MNPSTSTTLTGSTDTPGSDEPPTALTASPPVSEHPRPLVGRGSFAFSDRDGHAHVNHDVRQIDGERSLELAVLLLEFIDAPLHPHSFCCRRAVAEVAHLP